MYSIGTAPRRATVYAACFIIRREEGGQGLLAPGVVVKMFGDKGGVGAPGTMR